MACLASLVALMPVQLFIELRLFDGEGGDLIFRATQAVLLRGDPFLLLRLRVLLLPKRLVCEAGGDLRGLELLPERREVRGELGLLRCKVGDLVRRFVRLDPGGMGCRGAL